jgi:TolA-binding protein
MTLTDEELDREWKPNGRRPQSTVAQMFSQELMDIFRIDNSVADLDEKVDKRKQQINTQTTELEALEARIREMEMRLKGQAPNSGPSTSASASANTNNPNAPPPPAKDHPADQNRVREQQQQQQKYAGSRPGTARQGQPAVPGALPPTPAGSEDGDRERDA